ncbi:hypothetical protein K437DRAFT_253858 [Tilletiaria anomala UBC 951]|uniref:Uncharacterized protein n=1 Tax=Tilletiaria anomala (strain ATCC 24038 / CBS 436.72 / UBC 951) TaxID=1037660 RepID=A0A066WNT8_TILAU|nr:uncharacterized protein K437DRAFT_253858 [Tilletiaria anomala UBC 951]KDN52669.1 hypothetical protein K437DRAFT_253858 [Tilletiaria anomala UBC 951]
MVTLWKFPLASISALASGSSSQRMLPAIARPALCSCTRAAASSSASALQPSRRHASSKAAQLAKEERDERLRKGIELYHLTSTFFPAPRSGNSEPAVAASSSNSDLDTEIDNRIKEELAMQTELRGMSTTLGRSSGLEAPKFRNAGELVARATSDANYFSRAGRSDSVDDFQDSGDTFGPSNAFSPPPSTTSSSFSAFEEPALFDHMTLDRLRRQAFRFTSNASDKRPALGRKIMAHDEADQRGAMVRDALFGTVGLELPGLEIVRERVKEKRRRAAEAAKAQNTVQEASKESHADES